MEEPKVFISYSWTTQIHQERVKHWAERLLADGVEVILDIYDLKEGNDKYAFMESMVNDPKVTHILVICDQAYTEKADARKSGVGTESQIISSKVYSQAKQSKFIPIVCEFGADGEPFLPTFMKSLIWIDFSSSEAENENWEQLVRLLYGKPLHVKPKKGKTPTFISSDTPVPTGEAFAKFASLQQAVLQGKKGIKRYRRDFINACMSYADKLRVRERPNVTSMGEKVLEDCSKLKLIRDYLCDWILLESEVCDEVEFSEAVVEVLEKLRELKSKPPEISSWSVSWSEAHSVFVYETFLYIVAALIKTGAYRVLHEVFTSNYLKPSSESYGAENLERFDCFFGYSDTLQILAREGTTLLAPAATLLKRQADRQDIPFKDIMQAELLVLLMTFIIPKTRWYPQTLHYAPFNNPYPIFIRAAQHKYFIKLTIITGITSVDELRVKAREGHQQFITGMGHRFNFENNFWSSLNLDNLDSIK